MTKTDCVRQFRPVRGGGIQPKVIVEDFYANREPREYDKIAPRIIEDAKTTRGADVVSTIRASYYKTGERNIRENIVSGKGYEGVIEHIKCVGGLSDDKWGSQFHQQDRVYKGDIALCLPANLPGNSYKYIVAMRGRGDSNEQRLELNSSGCTNALTTVHKDNLILDGNMESVAITAIQKVGQISNEGSQCGTVVSDEGLSPTLSAGTHGYANAHVCTEYRIRKLTEKECFRLMGFKDSDFEKARAVNSATQIYKQTGNSIIRQFLIAIFLQLNIQGIKNWNDRTKEEREEFYKR